MNTINYYYTPQKRACNFHRQSQRIEELPPQTNSSAFTIYHYRCSYSRPYGYAREQGFQPRTDQAPPGYGATYA